MALQKPEEGRKKVKQSEIWAALALKNAPLDPKDIIGKKIIPGTVDISIKDAWNKGMVKEYQNREQNIPLNARKSEHWIEFLGPDQRKWLQRYLYEVAANDDNTHVASFTGKVYGTWHHYKPNTFAEIGNVKNQGYLGKFKKTMQLLHANQEYENLLLNDESGDVDYSYNSEYYPQQIDMNNMSPSVVDPNAVNSLEVIALVLAVFLFGVFCAMIGCICGAVMGYFVAQKNESKRDSTISSENDTHINT
eukprot:442824_1